MVEGARDARSPGRSTPGPMTTTTTLMMRSSHGIDPDERLDGPPFVHGRVRLGRAVEVGLVVEHEPGVDASFEDVVEELGDVDACWGGAAAPADVAEERLVERHLPVGDTDDADGRAGPGDGGSGLDRLLRAYALEGGVGPDTASQLTYCLVRLFAARLDDVSG